MGIIATQPKALQMKNKYIMRIDVGIFHTNDQINVTYYCGVLNKHHFYYFGKICEYRWLANFEQHIFHAVGENCFWLLKKRDPSSVMFTFANNVRGQHKPQFLNKYIRQFTFMNSYNYVNTCDYHFVLFS